MASFLCGAAFGAAMLAAGFHDPALVSTQLSFENWHMFQAFITATAGSAVIYTVAERLQLAKIPPRSSSPLGYFSAYDGNIVGGALLGAGMALSGSCPGTLLVQLATGVRTGFHALNGAIIGGIVWTGLLSKPIKQHVEAAEAKKETRTVGELLGLSPPAALLLFEAVCAAFLALTTFYGAQFTGVRYPGVIGGLFIAAAQLLSILMRRSMVGVSGSYEEIGNTIWWALKGSSGASKPQSYRNVSFACGVAGGAWILSQGVPSLVAGDVVEVSPFLATVGSASMIIGSRMAGGCTSGHGISGISLLSTASIVTITSAFAVGGLLAPLMA